ncbi:MAG TPA: hypothetical protein VMT97_02585 [Terriglobales bacterium]|nr:hypothetical protein [Terriglobales bacterium]
MIQIAVVNASTVVSDADGEAGDAHRNDNPMVVKALYKERPVTGARRYRRALPPATWLVSTVPAA